MPPYRSLGSIPRKRHIAHRREGGFRGEGIYYEEVITTGGFGRAYSIAYHLRPPTRVLQGRAGRERRDLEVRRSVDAPPPSLEDRRDTEVQGDPISGRVPILANSDLTIARCRPSEPQAELYRNASADEMLFIHKGRGTLHTMFGRLPFGPCDYVVIPTCTTYQHRIRRDRCRPICSSCESAVERHRSPPATSTPTAS